MGQAILEFPRVRGLQISSDTTLVLYQLGSQGTPRACSSRRRRASPVYLGRAVPPESTDQGCDRCPGASGHVRTTKERPSCLAGAPTAMGHGMSRCAPRMSAGHALCLTMSVVTHDKCAPHACSPRRDGKRLGAASSARPPRRRMAVGGPSVARTPHDSTPSSHERGTAGLEKGAMAFLDDAEATTYKPRQHIRYLSGLTFPYRGFSEYACALADSTS